MKTIKLTAAQAQSIIYSLDVSEAPPSILEFYVQWELNIFERKAPVQMKLTREAAKWLKQHLKATIATLREMVEDAKSSSDPYWINEARANKRNIQRAQEIIKKL